MMTVIASGTAFGILGADMSPLPFDEECACPFRGGDPILLSAKVYQSQFCVMKVGKKA